MKLKDKVALITGGSSGFGRESALLFAQEGAKVAIGDINDPAGQKTVESIKTAGGEAVYVHADVSKARDMEALVQKTVGAFGGIDVLFGNVGIVNKGVPVESIQEEVWDKIYAVNVKGQFLLAKYAVPEMKKNKKGSIIFTASIAAIRPRPMGSCYNSSKSAVDGFGKCLAIELGPHKIRVNVLNPVAADTPFMAPATEGMTPEQVQKMKEAVTAGIPLGRWCTPQDVATAALFLASDDSEFITGVSLSLDGGRAI